jgi:hypothetical protein
MNDGPKRAGKVLLTNTHRNQPILFHFAGGSVRLGPGESVEMAEHCRSSSEVSQLIHSGALHAAPARNAGAKRAADPKLAAKAAMEPAAKRARQPWQRQPADPSRLAEPVQPASRADELATPSESNSGEN